jgi:hypothetical protein
MSAQALSVALLARRFTLLADHVELLRSDRIERVGVMLRDSGHAANALDLELVGTAGSLDQICGYALRRLRRTGAAGLAAVLDVLGMLPPNHLLGLLYALPLARREAVRKLDGVWDHHAHEIEEQMPDALGEVERIVRLCADDERARLVAELPAEELRELEAFNYATLGLPAELEPEHRLMLHDSAMDELMVEELSALSPDDAQEAIEDAIRRGLDRWRAEAKR